MRDSIASRQPVYELAPGSGERWDMWPAIPDTAQRILDMGCGRGQAFAALRKHGLTVVGADVNSVFIEQARQVLDDVHIIDIEQSEWPTGWLNSFDVVVYADVLEHLVDPWKAL